MVWISVASEAFPWHQQAKELRLQEDEGLSIALCLYKGVQRPSKHLQGSCLSRLPPLAGPSEELFFSAGEEIIFIIGF